MSNHHITQEDKPSFLTTNDVNVLPQICSDTDYSLVYVSPFILMKEYHSGPMVDLFSGDKFYQMATAGCIGCDKVCIQYLLG